MYLFAVESDITTPLLPDGRTPNYVSFLSLCNRWGGMKPVIHSKGVMGRNNNPKLNLNYLCYWSCLSITVSHSFSQSSLATDVTEYYKCKCLTLNSNRQHVVLLLSLILWKINYYDNITFKYVIMPIIILDCSSLRICRCIWIKSLIKMQDILISLTAAICNTYWIPRDKFAVHQIKYTYFSALRSFTLWIASP